MAARDRLAGELKAAGETDAAAAVKTLKRPTVVAWGVNAAAREHPDDVGALREAGQELRRAQRKALSGGGGEDLRRATETRRAIVGPLTDAAMEALGDRAATHRDAIAATLDAASIDDELGDRLATGTLEKEARPTAGFGTIEGFEVLTGGGAEGEPDQVEEDRVAVQRERVKEARAAAQRAATAERAADRARKRADELKDKAAAAADAARDAESEARRLADEARTERKRADRAERSANV